MLLLAFHHCKGYNVFYIYLTFTSCYTTFDNIYLLYFSLLSYVCFLAWFLAHDYFPPFAPLNCLFFFFFFFGRYLRPCVCLPRFVKYSLDLFQLFLISCISSLHIPLFHILFHKICMLRFISIPNICCLVLHSRI